MLPSERVNVFGFLPMCFKRSAKDSYCAVPRYVDGIQRLTVTNHLLIFGPYGDIQHHSNATAFPRQHHCAVCLTSACAFI